MSLVSMIGPRPNLLGQPCRHAQAARGQPAGADQCRAGEDPLDRGAARRRLPHRHHRLHLARVGRRGRAGEGARSRLLGGDRLRAGRPQHPDPVGSRRLGRARADPGAAGDGGGASSPDPPRLAHPDRPRRRNGRGRARSITSAAWRATAPRRSIRTSPSRRWRQLRVQNGLPLKAYEVQKNYIKAVGKGLLKVMSKMGISTYQSYCGAQIFDAVGLHSGFVEKYFTGTATTIEGAGWQEIAEETVRRHRDAYGDNPIYRNMLDSGRRLCLPPARRGPCLDAGERRQAAARRARQQLGRVQGVRRDDQRAERAAADHPRPDGAEVGRHSRSRSRKSSRRPTSSSASPPAR